MNTDTAPLTMSPEQHDGERFYPPVPRYDSVFTEGVKWLDSLASDDTGSEQLDAAPLTMSQFANRADYEKAVAATRTVTPYDGYEVAPVYVETDGQGCEAMTTAEEARTLIRSESGSLIWSLYGHLSEGGVECIGDFATETDALGVYSKITGRPLPEPGDSMHALPPAIGIPTRHYPTDEAGLAV